MKIQEMKSGILHLNRRMENERQQNNFESRAIGVAFAEPELAPAADSEIDEALWSVISFDQMEACCLTYNQAAALMAELDSQNVPGLCVVTDDAAARITR
jgi:hypothetical protein